ncbi:MAG: MlaD family protein [Chthoniobacteraceae bacterium]
MKKNASDYFVAMSVIACSLVLLGALAYALGGWKPKSKGRTLEVDFADVTGVKLHSEVRYAGAPAGTVAAIRLLTEEERIALPKDKRGNAVRVSLQLDEKLAPLPGDVAVSISSDTLLSDKFIALSSGTADAPRIADGALLQGHGGGNIDDLISAIGPFLEKAQTAIAGIEPLLMKTSEAVDAVKMGVNDILPKVGEVATSLKQATASADSLLLHADKMIANIEGPLKTDLVELRATLASTQDTMKSATSLLNRTDKNLDARMSELGVVLQNLKIVSTHAKAFAQAIGEKPNRVIFSGKPQSLPSEQTILRSTRPVPAR